MSRHLPALNPRRAAGGFTLVEALVALMALSIGLLGVAGLQLAGVRANQSAAWRSQATYLSYDILERMRLNSTNRAAYEVDIAEASAVPDVIAWKANLAQTLPGGDGGIALDAGDDRMVTITVQWEDARGDTVVEDDSVTTLTFTMRSRL